MQNHRILTSLAECIITSWSNCGLPSSFINAHVLTMCFIVTIVYIVIVMFCNHSRPLLTLTFVFLAVRTTYIALEMLSYCREFLCWMIAMQQLYLIDHVMSCYSLLLMCGVWFSSHELLQLSFPVSELRYLATVDFALPYKVTIYIPRYLLIHLLASWYVK